MQDRALDDALEAQGGLSIHIRLAGYPGRVAIDEIGQFLAQVVDVGRACP
jgi:hypothetical protein